LVKGFSPVFAFTGILIFTSMAVFLMRKAAISHSNRKNLKTITILVALVSQFFVALAFIRLLKIPFIPSPQNSIPILTAIAILIGGIDEPEMSPIKKFVWFSLLAELLGIIKAGLPYIFLPFYLAGASYITFSVASRARSLQNVR